MKAPPTSLKELVEGDPAEKIVIEDPRTSTPGLGLLLWVKSVYGERRRDAWAKLKDRVLTVTPGWSEAYGLFTKGEAPMVLSYTTSPAYHMVAESTDRYQAAAFSEGHYLQIEVAGITTTGAKNPLASELPRLHDRARRSRTSSPRPTGCSRPPRPRSRYPAFDKLVKPAKTSAVSPTRWPPTARPGSTNGCPP